MLKDEEGREEGDCKVEFVEYENHTYGAIFDFEEKPADSTVTVAKTAVRRLVSLQYLYHNFKLL